MAVRLKGWRFGAFIGSLISAVGGTLYFTAVRPMLHPEIYREVREVAEPQLKPKVDY